MRRNKYGNAKVMFQGIKFDSKRERDHYIILKDREKRGEISDLAIQVPIFLMGRDGPIRTPTGRRMYYKADFVYRENGVAVVEDAKGFPTPEYKIKKAILLAQGVEIIEV